MRGCLKVATIAVGVTLIGVAVLALSLVFRADAYTKRALERTLSYVTATDLTLDRIRMLPLQESIEIRRLAVGNPQPFKKGPAIEVKRILIRFDLRTLLSRAPTIRQVLLQGVRIHLRYRVGEGTNLGSLARDAAARGKTVDPDAPRGARRTFVIKEFRCEDAHVSLSTNLVPLASAGFTLAPFSLKDPDRSPVTVGQVTSLFLRSVLRETLTLKGLLSPLVSLIHDELSGDNPP